MANIIPDGPIVAPSGLNITPDGPIVAPLYNRDTTPQDQYNIQPSGGVIATPSQVGPVKSSFDQVSFAPGSSANTALEGLGQGITGGLLNNIAATYAHAFGPAQGVNTGSYSDYLKTAQDITNQDYNAHPLIYSGTSAVGSLPLITALGPTASSLSKWKQGLTIGGELGALQGAGETNNQGEAPSVGEFVGNVAKQAAIGTTIGGVTQGLGKVFDAGRTNGLRSLGIIPPKGTFLPNGANAADTARFNTSPLGKEIAAGEVPGAGVDYNNEQAGNILDNFLNEPNPVVNPSGLGSTPNIGSTSSQAIEQAANDHANMITGLDPLNISNRRDQAAYDAARESYLYLQGNPTMDSSMVAAAPVSEAGSTLDPLRQTHAGALYDYEANKQSLVFNGLVKSWEETHPGEYPTSAQYQGFQDQAKTTINNTNTDFAKQAAKFIALQIGVPLGGYLTGMAAQTAGFPNIGNFTPPQYMAGATDLLSNMATIRSSGNLLNTGVKAIAPYLSKIIPETNITSSPYITIFPHSNPILPPGGAGLATSSAFNGTNSNVSPPQFLTPDGPIIPPVQIGDRLKALNNSTQ